MHPCFAGVRGRQTQSLYMMEGSHDCRVCHANPLESDQKNRAPKVDFLEIAGNC